jgi:hypothetical protein
MREGQGLARREPFEERRAQTEVCATKCGDAALLGPWHRLKRRAQTEVCATVLCNDVLRKESPALAANGERLVCHLEVERIAASYRC